MSSAMEFLQEIKRAAQQMGIAPSTLCQKAVRAGGLVRRLERGGNVTLQRVDQIRAYIRDNQPPTAAKTPEHEGTEAT